MDFLDPRKRRTHRNRLIIGYVLVSVAIVLGAVVLVYSANGYGINTKTGDIVQNGLLFIDSKPSGADIYLNGQNHGSKTSSRLILPAGNYNIDLKRAGYRDWTRRLVLTEHSITRYVYPFLFPVKLAEQPLKNYATTPPLVTNSPDRHWLLVQAGQQDSSGVTFDEFDTSNLKLPSKAIILPAGLLTNPTAVGSQLKLIEWSTDNKNMLLEHSFVGGREFIVFNRETPADSFNVNKIFSMTPTKVALHNNKIDQFYIFDAASGDLQLGNVASHQLTLVLNHVIDFKPNGSNLIIYVTNQEAANGQVWARIWDSGKTYPLYSFAAGSHYLIDMAQYQGDWYYAAGCDKSERVNIYKNPLGGLENTAIGKALPLISLVINGADHLSFSTNTRFIEAESGQSLAVYDFETQTRYQYTLTKPLTGNLNWMDGHRLIGASSGQVFVTDYDSTNQQILVPTLSNDELFFDANYNHLLGLTPSSNGTGVNLENFDLRAGVDLPKQ